ncbi:MAG: metal dependent phosphohydrolase [Actinomycetia bacterium]|jgi:(p)ppGpp synthase/HD superfamily hydrolase|nr:metal dependent phosphohydrolase [Actinomycetes bacterium]
MDYAFVLHADQRRKQRDVPYVGHLLGVASIVMDDGGDEDQVVAALLHDAAEDQGGRRVLTEISRRFGPRVSAIVEACSDTLESPKPPWRPRKEAWLASIAGAPPESWRVMLADKLHNARATVTDVHAEGVAALDLFNGGREGTVWYYRSAAEELARVAPGLLADELRRTVGELDATLRAATTDREGP